MGVSPRRLPGRHTQDNGGWDHDPTGQIPSTTMSRGRSYESVVSGQSPEGRRNRQSPEDRRDSDLFDPCLCQTSSGGRGRVWEARSCQGDKVGDLSTPHPACKQWETTTGDSDDEGSDDGGDEGQRDTGDNDANSEARISIETMFLEGQGRGVQGVSDQEVLPDQAGAEQRNPEGRSPGLEGRDEKDRKGEVKEEVKEEEGPRQ